MDPSIFEKLNALQNMQRQCQAAEQHEEQARLNRNLQSELLAIKRQLEAEENKPKCPHCGGGANIGYKVCKNCAREVIWVGNFIGLPGQEEKLNELHEISLIIEEEKRKQIIQEREEFRR
ncbi:MAG TPA: hypothetical protein DEP12_11940, partial [Planctomycetaceae bacterium]|nr:hypothetical protein [Planctomycetaceae bacterium]